MSRGFKRALNYADIQDLFRLEVDVQGNPTLYRKNWSNNGKWKNKGEWLKVKQHPLKSGYTLVEVNKKVGRYMISNIYFALHHARSIPNHLMIDHIDGDPTNNNMYNLRLVTQRENGQNMQMHREGAEAGIWLCKNEKVWYSKIKLKGRGIHLGVHKNKEVALARYQTACWYANNLIGKSPPEIRGFVNTRIEISNFLDNNEKTI